ncbi:unnamed protein product [Amoebophrya sp. A25]|nr:unnamed protein product [Amoebophrya sp. A25]|eukprot:GSA25T00000684001.1
MSSLFADLLGGLSDPILTSSSTDNHNTSLDDLFFGPSTVNGGVGTRKSCFSEDATASAADRTIEEMLCSTRPPSGDNCEDMLNLLTAGLDVGSTMKMSYENGIVDKRGRADLDILGLRNTRSTTSLSTATTAGSLADIGLNFSRSSPTGGSSTVLVPNENESSSMTMKDYLDEILNVSAPAIQQAPGVRSSFLENLTSRGSGSTSAQPEAEEEEDFLTHMAKLSGKSMSSSSFPPLLDEANKSAKVKIMGTGNRLRPAGSGGVDLLDFVGGCLKKPDHRQIQYPYQPSSTNTAAVAVPPPPARAGLSVRLSSPNMGPTQTTTMMDEYLYSRSARTSSKSQFSDPSWPSDEHFLSDLYASTFSSIDRYADNLRKNKLSSLGSAGLGTRTQSTSPVQGYSADSSKTLEKERSSTGVLSIPRNNSVKTVPTPPVPLVASASVISGDTDMELRLVNDGGESYDFALCEVGGGLQPVELGTEKDILICPKGLEEMDTVDASTSTGEGDAADSRTTDRKSTTLGSTGSNARKLTEAEDTNGDSAAPNCDEDEEKTPAAEGHGTTKSATTASTTPAASKSVVLIDVTTPSTNHDLNDSLCSIISPVKEVGASLVSEVDGKQDCTSTSEQQKPIEVLLEETNLLFGGEPEGNSTVLGGGVLADTENLEQPDVSFGKKNDAANLANSDHAHTVFEAEVGDTKNNFDSRSTNSGDSNASSVPSLGPEAEAEPSGGHTKCEEIDDMQHTTTDVNLNVIMVTDEEKNLMLPEGKRKQGKVEQVDACASISRQVENQQEERVRGRPRLRVVASMNGALRFESTIQKPEAHAEVTDHQIFTAQSVLKKKQSSKKANKRKSDHKKIFPPCRKNSLKSTTSCASPYAGYGARIGPPSSLRGEEVSLAEKEHGDGRDEVDLAMLMEGQGPNGEGDPLSDLKRHQGMSPRKQRQRSRGHSGSHGHDHRRRDTRGGREGAASSRNRSSERRRGNNKPLRLQPTSSSSWLDDLIRCSTAQPGEMEALAGERLNLPVCAAGPRKPIPDVDNCITVITRSVLRTPGPSQVEKRLEAETETNEQQQRGDGNDEKKTRHDTSDKHREADVDSSTADRDNVDTSAPTSSKTAPDVESSVPATARKPDGGASRETEKNKTDKAKTKVSTTTAASSSRRIQEEQLLYDAALAPEEFKLRQPRRDEQRHRSSSRPRRGGYRRVRSAGRGRYRGAHGRDRDYYRYDNDDYSHKRAGTGRSGEREYRRRYDGDHRLDDRDDTNTGSCHAYFPDLFASSQQQLPFDSVRGTGCNKRRKDHVAETPRNANKVHVKFSDEGQDAVAHRLRGARDEGEVATTPRAAATAISGESRSSERNKLSVGAKSDYSDFTPGGGLKDPFAKLDLSGIL